MLIHQMAQTWNTADALTAIRMNVTDTASGAASLLLDLLVGGSSKFKVGKAGDTVLASAAALGWSTDLTLYRDAADVLALRRSTNPQRFNIYNTFTDDTHNEGGGFIWSGNVMYVQTFKGASGGTYQSMGIVAPSITFYPKSTPAAAWEMNISGHFICPSDNTYDIGGSGSNRPRNIFAAGEIQGTYKHSANAVTDAALVSTHSITVKDANGDSYKVMLVAV